MIHGEDNFIRYTGQRDYLPDAKKDPAFDEYTEGEDKLILSYLRFKWSVIKQEGNEFIIRLNFESP